MIKRISFATRREDVTAAAFAAAWPDAAAGAAAAAAHAPPAARPSRIAVCVTLPGLTGPDPRHDGILIEWFADAGRLRRFLDWQESRGGPLPRAAALLDPGASPVVVAEEAVLRGAAWLDRRWRDHGDALKHMALAVRAAGLTPAEFSRAWRSRAGQVRRPGTGQVTVIPDEARGRAYVQNHPCPAGEQAYDAVNEVYVDDLAGLRTRIEWFRRNLSGPAEADLVRRSWFIAAREHVVLACPISSASRRVSSV